MVNKANGTKEYMRVLIEALDSHPNSQQVFELLSNRKNTWKLNKNWAKVITPKILFMDPKCMTEATGRVDGFYA
jgi:hypothetical protein